MKTLVWFKRDLRVADNTPLAMACEHGEAVGLFVIENAWLASPEFDAQHLAFTLARLRCLSDELEALRLPFVVVRGDLQHALANVRRQFEFARIISHEETGPGWTFERDKLVARWCNAHRVAWNEIPQTGVVRRLKDRRGWAANWQRRMDAEIVAPKAIRFSKQLVDFRAMSDATFSDPLLKELALSARPIPGATAKAAQDTLASFLSHRGSNYRREISSPSSAEMACSRLSVYLSFGVLSMRQVHRATEARIAELMTIADTLNDTEARRFAYHLRGFAGRLRWHCHFMQKLEDEPAIEFQNFARSADGLREGSFNKALFDAWRHGETGMPMVDACMRSLNATGWLNFRMRAMLVSTASYHLWLHWRETGLHLARQFLDFEAGIHWSQMQMQSGTTGINTLRIYSPSKQALDHDPNNDFIRRWVPEFESARYVRPIVDEKEAMRLAKERLYGIRATTGAKTEAAQIQAKHGSRKSGLLQNGSRRARTPKAAETLSNNQTTNAQGSLFD